MGNCCKTASSMEWGGEDWSSLAVPEERKKTNRKNKKSSRKVFDLISASSSVSSACLDEHGNGRRIKIKMTKREFEVLLEEIEKQKQKQKQQGKVLSGEAVLESLLMKARGDNHKPWSPVLESISEF